MRFTARSVCVPRSTATASGQNCATSDILESAVRPQDRVKLSSLLAEIGRKVNLTEAEFAIFESAGEHSPARSASLGGTGGTANAGTFAETRGDSMLDYAERRSLDSRTFGE